MTSTTAAQSATPIRVSPWCTIWSEETIIATIAGGKTHIVRRTVSSPNSEMNVADSAAKRSEYAMPACGTTRRGRVLQVGEAESITCEKCAKRA